MDAPRLRCSWFAGTAGRPHCESRGSGAEVVAFDIDIGIGTGTGTGVLSAVLALKGADQVVATDQDPRELACAREDVERMRLPCPVKVMQADLFPQGLASVIVCNPPWLPAQPGSPLEAAVYDEGSRMVLGFLKGLPAHLAPGGGGWLILSDLPNSWACARADLLAAIEAGGLKVASRIDARPPHLKVADRPRERRKSMSSTRMAPSSGIRLKRAASPSQQPKAPRRPKNLRSHITPARR